MIGGVHLLTINDMADPCHLKDGKLIQMLKQLYGSNSSNWIKAVALSRNGSCNGSDVAHGITNDTQLSLGDYGFPSAQYGKIFYAYLSPVIILVGLFGNGISVKVFRRKSLRRLSASLYLSAISISDSLVLLTYVLFGWFDKGLPLWPSGHHLPIIHIHGVCQTFVFFSYVFRFVSVWLIVVFTVERYIAACRPLKRRIICTKTFGRRAIMVVCLLAVCVSVFKPVLTGTYDASINLVVMVDEDWQDLTRSSSKVCTGNPDHVRLNLALELIYGLLTTAVPFFTIALFNLFIINSLFTRNAALNKLKGVHSEGCIRWEFTVTLLVVSSCFVCLNLPYFVIWCNQLLQSLRIGPGHEPLKTVMTAHRRRNSLYVTKTIYYLNYCVNFFLYLMTGTFYRGEFKSLCRDRRRSLKVPLISSYTVLARTSSLAMSAGHRLKRVNNIIEEETPASENTKL